MQSGQPTPLNVPVQLAIQPQLQAMPSPTPSQGWTDRTFGQDFVSFLVIIGFIAIIIVTAVKKKWDANAVRVISITSIIFIAVFAALTVDNERNAAAVFALLGTVAGYILGRSERRDSKNQEASVKPAESEPPEANASR
jgi:hypothetical protein